MKTKFTIGEVIKDSGSFGNVTVKDIFRSETNPKFYCYRVEDEQDSSFLTSEEELILLEELEE